MISTKPLAHNRIALMVDGFVVYVGDAATIRKIIGV